MTATGNQNQVVNQEKTESDKEINFRKLEENLKNKYEKELAAANARNEELHRLMQEQARARSAPPPEPEEEDDDDEPYVDRKKFKKGLESFERKLMEKFDKRVETKAAEMLQRERQQTWMKQNPDYHQVMQHAQDLADKYPDLAESILEMPEGFERQKLVYKNIKSFGLHKPEEKTNINDKIEANRRSPYYQPTNIGSAPYGQGGDFSKSGQKNAYEKMLELKSKLRL